MKSKINRLFKEKKAATDQFKIDHDYPKLKNSMLDIELQFAKIDIDRYIDALQTLLIKNNDLCIVIKNLEENYSADIELLDENRDVIEQYSNRGFISRLTNQSVIQELIVFEFLVAIEGVRYKINQESLDALFPKILKRLELNAKNYKDGEFKISTKIPYETVD